MDIMEALSIAIKDACREQNRYRTLIVIGKPRSGKSSLLRQFCSQSGWNYINYTLQPGFFDMIENIENYTPQDLKQSILTVMEDFLTNNPENRTRGLVIDELESILATWRTDIQDTFFRIICSETRLPCGLIVTTRLRQHSNAMKQCIKNPLQIFNVSGR